MPSGHGKCAIGRSATSEPKVIIIQAMQFENFGGIKPTDRPAEMERGGGPVSAIWPQALQPSPPPTCMVGRPARSLLPPPWRRSPCTPNPMHLTVAATLAAWCSLAAATASASLLASTASCTCTGGGGSGGASAARRGSQACRAHHMPIPDFGDRARFGRARLLRGIGQPGPGLTSMDVRKIPVSLPQRPPCEGWVLSFGRQRVTPGLLQGPWHGPSSSPPPPLPTTTKIKPGALDRRSPWPPSPRRHAWMWLQA